MGCQSIVELEQSLTFSICTHDPDTGVLTDADSAPSYRVYEDETATSILDGSMAKLDDGNTTGFYTEQIACTAANGFEDGKSYTIYIEATVDGDTGGISYAFTVTSRIAREGADSDTLETLSDEIAVIDTVVDAIKAKTDNLPGAVPKNVELASLAFVLYSNTDHVSPKTGLSVTATISKDGGAFAACTNSVSEISNGVYKITLTATEMNADVVVVRFVATGADDRVIVIKTDS